MFQPIGNENVAPPAAASVALTRDKATGSTSSVIGGLKVAARRTVFADLSNTAANQVAIVHNGQKKAVKNDGKPNDIQGAGGKDAFRRPAQRPLKPLAGTANQPNATSVMDWLGRADVAQPAVKAGPSKKAAVMVYNDVVPGQNIEAEQQKHVPAATAANQHKIRQYKSQPQLKPEAPILRRTQSRLLGAGATASGFQPELPFMAELTEALYEDAAEHLDNIDDHAESVAKTEGVSLSVSTSATALPLDSLGYQEEKQSVTVISEPEEYWEEEEDEVDDDQGYTTAHSFRSRGDLTTGGVTTLPYPKVTSKVLRELEVARLFVESNRSQFEVEEDTWDVSMVVEYGEEIFEYMRELEVRADRCPHRNSGVAW